MMIIRRYLVKEIMNSFFGTTFLLLLIFGSEQLLSYMRAAAGGRMPLHLVFLLLSLQLPVLLTFLLPLSFFIAILLAYGRLYVDSEMAVLSSCGVSRRWFVRCASGFGMIIMLFVALLSLWLAPKMEEYSARIIAASKAEAMELLVPGRFSLVPNTNWVFYVASVNQDKKELQTIFAAEECPKILAPKVNNASSLGVLFANSAEVITDSRGRFLALKNGNRYNGIPGQRDYQIVNFKAYGIRVKPANAAWRTEENMLSTKFLWQNQNDLRYAAELHWRLALPIAALILTLIAVPLSKVKPRFGRYASIVPATLFYILYANLIFLGRAWLLKGTIPSLVGMWWIHALMLIFALCLYIDPNRLRWKK